LKILANEIGRVAIVRKNAAYLGSRNEYILGLLLPKETLNRMPVSQINLGVSAKKQIRVSPLFQRSMDGRSNQPAMARDKYPAVFFHNQQTLQAQFS